MGVLKALAKNLLVHPERMTYEFEVVNFGIRVDGHTIISTRSAGSSNLKTNEHQSSTIEIVSTVTYSFHPKSLVAIMSFIDSFKLVPVKWTRLTELFAIRPVGDKTFDPLKFARPVGIHNGFHILLLL